MREKRLVHQKRSYNLLSLSSSQIQKHDHFILWRLTPLTRSPHTGLFQRSLICRPESFYPFPNLNPVACATKYPAKRDCDGVSTVPRYVLAICGLYIMNTTPRTDFIRLSTALPNVSRKTGKSIKDNIVVRPNLSHRPFMHRRLS